MFYTTSSTSSSTSSLVSQKAKTSYRSPKNYEAAFGALSSSLGFGSTVPSLLPRSSKTKSSTTLKSAPSPSPSSASSLSSTSTSSSPKDYEAAFGALSSSYGWGHSVPVLPTRSEKKHSNKSSRKASSPPQPSTPNHNTSSAPLQKNYEEAFGALSASYGFSSGGAAVSFRKS